MRSPTCRTSSFRGLLLILALAPLVRCGEAPTEPLMPTPAPTASTATPTAIPQTATPTPTPTGVVQTPPPSPTPIPPTPPGNAQTPTPGSTPTPGPLTTASLAGRWVGTFVDDGNSFPVEVRIINTGYGSHTPDSGVGWDELWADVSPGNNLEVTLLRAGQSLARLRGRASETEMSATGHRYNDSTHRMSIRLARSQ